MKPHDIFKGLGDPTRLRIVALLLEHELCVCDILDVLKLPQSTVSRHLIKLKSAGLVMDRREGKWVHYKLAETPIVTGIRHLLQTSLAGVEPFSHDRDRLHGLVASGRCAASR